jgi:hypothetical protein
VVSKSTLAAPVLELNLESIKAVIPSKKKANVPSQDAPSMLSLFCFPFSFPFIP